MFVYRYCRCNLRIQDVMIGMRVSRPSWGWSVPHRDKSIGKHCDPDGTNFSSSKIMVKLIFLKIELS